MEVGQLPTLMDLSASEVSSQRFEPHKRIKHRMLSLALDQAFVTASTQHKDFS